MDTLIERLETVLKRYQEIDELMQDENIIKNFEEYKKLAKEKSSLTEGVEKYLEYKKELENIEDLKELRNDDDKEIAQMAKEELVLAEEKLLNIVEELKLILAPKDPNDDKNVIVEIRGAVGGDEANIFAGDLFRMYTRYADSVGWKIEVLESMEAAMGGYSLISFSVTGEKVYSKLKYESGAHRVQRVPLTEASGRIHTSVATVIVMPEADEVDVEINMNDLKIDTFRASGAGGQHVNKTDSAVRITHLPTGIVVECQDGRSQHENKEKALVNIRTRVYDMVNQQADQERSEEKRIKIGSGDRSEKIRTYNYPQNRVTDHRINLSLQQLDSIMEGNLEGLLMSLVNADQKLKIEGESL
jgi:peptide chain release factor 1